MEGNAGRGSRTALIALGCLAVAATLVLGLFGGGVAGYLLVRRSEATPQPTATPQEASNREWFATLPWETYQDPGYLAFRHPPHWLILPGILRDAPTDHCHCYWVIMSEQMVQNAPAAESVREWFGRQEHTHLAPGTAWIEILRADSEYAPPVDLGQPIDTTLIGGRYRAEVFQLDPYGTERGYRYTDERGRPWIILVLLPDGFADGGPMLELVEALLASIDHR